jgi:hypothetical protein
MKDLWKFLTTPPFGKINDIGDLIALLFVGPIYLIVWGGILFAFGSLIAAFNQDAKVTCYVIGGAILAYLLLKYVVFPAVGAIYTRRDEKRFEQERPERELAAAKYEAASQRRKEEADMCDWLKYEMRRNCSHPSTQIQYLGASTYEGEAKECVACGSYWEMGFKQSQAELMSRYSIVGPVIPLSEMDLFGKYQRNHVGVRTVEHWQELLDEIKNGDYYYNLKNKKPLQWAGQEWP